MKPAMKISLFGEKPDQILPKNNNNKMMPDTKAVVKDDLQVKASSGMLCKQPYLIYVCVWSSW